MDVNQSAPIIIQSDDEDDDVVWVKEEKAVEQDKKEEDDVIFLSEEQPQQQPGPGKSERLKKMSKEGGSSSKSLSSEDEDDSFGLSQFLCHTSEFSSINIENNILRPLDFSQDTSPSSSSPITCQTLSTQKLFQGPSCSVTGPEQLSKTVRELHINASLEGSPASGGKAQQCTPLKLPENPSPNQALNTPVCKVVLGKEWSDMHWPGTQDCMDGAITAGSSKDIIANETSVMKNKQIAPVNFGGDIRKDGNKEAGQPSLSTAGCNTGPQQSIGNLNSNGLDNVGTLFPTLVDIAPSVASDLTLKNVSLASVYIQDFTCVQTIQTGHPQPCPNRGLKDDKSHLTPLCSNSCSQLDFEHTTLKDALHLPVSKTSSQDHKPPVKLDLAHLNTDEVNRMLDFLSPETDSHSQGSTSASQNSSPTDNEQLFGSTTRLLKGIKDLPQLSLASIQSHTIKLSCSLNTSDISLSDRKRSSVHSTHHSSSSKISKKLSAAQQRHHNLKLRHYVKSKSCSHLCCKATGDKIHQGHKCKKDRIKHRDPILHLSSHSCKSRSSDKEKKNVYKSYIIDHSKMPATDKRKPSKICNDYPAVVKKAKILEAPSVSDPGKPSLKMKLKLLPSKAESSSSSSSLPKLYLPLSYDKGLKKALLKRQKSMGTLSSHEVKQSHLAVHRSISENDFKEDSSLKTMLMCVTCAKSVPSSKLSKCGSGHGVCVTCLEVQVKAILSGDVKPKNIKCAANTCMDTLSFDELKQTLPSFVVDILEEKLDKEYLSYITKWMFTDEQLKSRSEFATSDTKTSLCPALKMRKYEEIYTLESRDPTEDLPTFWTPMERGAPVMVYEVVPDTEEYTALALQFHETLRFPEYDIVRIIRVQNPILWKYFALKRSEMVQDNDGMDVTEKQLYHGTHRSTLEAIARKGFDWRLSGKHGTVFGCGSYFAKNARYSHGYTDRAGNGISVKSGTLPTRYMGPAPVSDPSFYSGLFTYSQRNLVLSLPQPPALALPPSGGSQIQPPQPPPAHYHLPPPPPAHGLMSSLQVPAHNKISCCPPSMASTAGGLAASSSNGTASNPPTSKYRTSLAPTVSTFTYPGILSSLAMPGRYCNFIGAPSSLPVPVSGNSFPSNSIVTSVNKTVFCSSGNPPQSISNQPPALYSSTGNTHNYPSNGSNRLSSCISTQMVNPPRIPDAVFLPVTGAPKNNLLSDLLTDFSTNDSGSNSRNSITARKDHEESCSYQNGPSTTKLSRAHERGTLDLTAAFSRNPDSETHCMFVARVLVGRHTGGKAGLKRPPPLDDKNPFGKSYDSCVDDIFNPQVYVIFDSNQAYPEYVIEYNWNKAHDL